MIIGLCSDTEGQHAEVIFVIRLIWCLIFPFPSFKDDFIIRERSTRSVCTQSFEKFSNHPQWHLPGKVSEVCFQTSVCCIMFPNITLKKTENRNELHTKKVVGFCFLGPLASSSRQNNWLTRLFWTFQMIYFSVSTDFIHIWLVWQQKWKMYQHEVFAWNDCCCKDLKGRLLQVFKGLF